MSPPWYRRWWSATLRAVGIQDRPRDHLLGADWLPGVDARPGYDVAEAMSAMAAFPWVVACLDAKATDLSGLPLRVQRGRGKAAVQVDEHPVLDLLDQPTRQVSGLRFRRQWVVDFDLSGNAYAVMLFTGAIPSALVRLHPERTTIQPDPREGVGAYVFDRLGTVERYDPGAVLHVAAMSYESGPQGLYGQGKIRALHLDLVTDLRAQKRSADTAKTGRPDVIISPADKEDNWTEPTRKVIKEAYDKMLSGGGAMVIGAGAKLDLPTWNPRDMEFEKVRVMARDAVLAAFHCPPSRVGLPTANFATQREQMQTYWEALRGDAALYDEQYTRLAQRFDSRARVYHDFSEVRSMQESRTERLQRVTEWYFLGATPAAAAAYEGFDDAPVGEVATPAAPPVPTESERAAIGRAFGVGPALALVDPLVRDLEWSAPLAAPVTGEADRAAMWRSFLTQVHEPAERAMAAAALRALREQRARIVAKLGTLGEKAARAAVTRDVADDVLGTIFDVAAERSALSDAMEATLRRALDRAFRASMQQLGDPVAYDPARVAREVERQLGQLVSNVTATTRDEVGRIVREGIADGASVAEMQRALQESSKFAPSRALLIARTETTHAVNAGAVTAYALAADGGVALRQEWLSARDGEVREAHLLLDGQVVDVGALFTVPGGRYAGETAKYPGDFDHPAGNCNCRCTLIPVVGDAA